MSTNQMDPNDMSDDLSEQQLRKALGTVNDLEPPTDELFVQRAIIRGRARTARRRSGLLGAAAALVVVAGVGGVWSLGQLSGSTPTAASGGYAAEGAREDSTLPEPAGPAAGSETEVPGVPTSVPTAPTSVLVSPNRATGVPGVRDAAAWLPGPDTPQKVAFTGVEGTLVATYPDVFSGAYAPDATNDKVVVAVTRRDPALEALVTKAMPAPSDVEFVVAARSYNEKLKVERAVRRDIEEWKAKGVTILDVRIEGRSDSVVVVADEGGTPGLVAAQYGDAVTVTPGLAPTATKLPNGQTLPATPQP